jgi:hypothetical protein
VRVPARSPEEARERYLRFLQQSLSCVSREIWFVADRPRGQRGELSLTTSRDPLEMPMEGGGRLYLSAGQHFRFVPDDRYQGEWKVRTDGYAYRVGLSADPSDYLVAWHWHPDSRPDPHLHVGLTHPQVAGFRGMHVPTGRVSFEEVLRFLVIELKLRPLRRDWEAVLSETEGRFRAFRTWPRPRTPPPGQGGAGET